MGLNKLGNVTDVVFLVMIFFSVVVIAVVLTRVNDTFENAVLNVTSDPDVTSTVSDFRNRIPRAMDSGLLFAYIASHIAIIFLGLLLRSHPLLFPVLFIALLVIVALSAFVSNAWNDIAGTAALESYSEEFPMSGWIVDNYVLVTLLFGFLDIIIFVLISSFLEGGGGL